MEQCHGAAGQGVGETFPKLAGQSAEYIANQLKAWKDGKRSNDPLHLMTGISSKLNDFQAGCSVAAYYAMPEGGRYRDNAARIEAMSERITGSAYLWVAGHLLLSGLRRVDRLHIGRK